MNLGQSAGSGSGAGAATASGDAATSGVPGGGWRQVRTRRVWTGAAVFGLVAVVCWLVTQSQYALNAAILAELYAIVAASWDLTLGYSGVFNFAHAAFFGIGAYVCGIVTTDLQWSPWLAIVAAVAGGAAGAALMAGAVARLRGIYVALVSFAFAELVLTLLTSSPSISGGESGIVLIPSLTLGKWDLSGNEETFFFICLGVLIACTTILRLLVRSPFGLSLQAARDFEDYASSRGVSVMRTRTSVIVISSMFASGAGALFALYSGVASPDLFGFSTSTLLLTMVIVGGVGSIYGPIVGAIVITAFTNLRQIAALDTESYLLTAAIILIVLWILPRGLWSLMHVRRAALKQAGRHFASTALRARAWPQTRKRSAGGSRR